MRELIFIGIIGVPQSVTAQSIKADSLTIETDWTMLLANAQINDHPCWEVSLTEIYQLWLASASVKRKFSTNRHIERIEKKQVVRGINNLINLKNELRVRADLQVDGEHEYVIEIRDGECHEEIYIFDDSSNFDFGKLEPYLKPSTTTRYFWKLTKEGEKKWEITRRHR